MALTIATWNINSLRIRLDQMAKWLEREKIDIVALQETKIQDHHFPLKTIKNMGYHALYCGQKSFNGVAILSRLPFKDGITDLPGSNDPQRRLLAMTIGNVRVCNVYVPNGYCIGSKKYDYKLKWLEHFSDFIAQELKYHKKLLIVGDFNIAPQDCDVYDPIACAGKVLVSPKERQAFTGLIELGLVDVFRQWNQPANSFTWWDYRNGQFWKNNGLRIDLILATPSLAMTAKWCNIDRYLRKSSRPSDHAPVIATFC